MTEPSLEPRMAICAECGASFRARRTHARFCSPGHQVAFGNRMAARGKVLAPYVLAWIQGRGGGYAGTHPIAAQAMREITAISRDFLEDDKRVGRPPVLDYVDALLGEGFRHCDRKRPVSAGARPR